MEPTAPVSVTNTSRTTPKDFFLWLGVIIALYGSVSAVIALLFEYINYAFPDALASYADPYGGPMRIAMAAIIVLVPTLVVLLEIIRRTIVKEPGKANIWVRRWAIGLTLFIAVITMIADLITLINTFLGGEITVRFGLKALVVLLVAAGVFMHFLADTWNYWTKFPKRAMSVAVGVAILALAVVISGFFIVGSPQDVRNLRLDAQRVNDLQNIQYQVINYWQERGTLPKALSDLSDSISGNLVPMDPQTKSAYEYKITGDHAFQLCATFAAETPDIAGRGAFGNPNQVSLPYPAGYPDGGQDNWNHGVGHICFDRTIDPARYPVRTLKPDTKPL